MKVILGVVCWSCFGHEPTKWPLC